MANENSKERGETRAWRRGRGWLLGCCALLGACASNPPPPVDTPQSLPPAEPSADLTKAPPEPGDPAPPADAPSPKEKPQPEH